MTYFYYLLVFLMLLRISYRDYKEHYIYDADLLKLAGIAFAYQVYARQPVTALAGLLVGLVIGLVIYYPTLLLYKEEVFGFGDVLLLGVLGLVLGLPGFINYFVYSVFIIGFLASVAILIKPEWHRLQLPLAPALSLCLPIYLGMGNPTVYDLYKIFVTVKLLLGGV